MSELFAALLRMSTVAGLAALVVMAARAVLKKLGAPRPVLFLLWAVVLFRMVCPVSFESPAALLSAQPVGAGVLESVPDAPSAPSAPALDSGGDAAPEAPVTKSDGGLMPPSAPSVPEAPVWTKIGGKTPLMGILATIWAVGAAGLCGWTLVSYRRLRRRVDAAVKAADGAWESDRIDAPFVLGFFPPKVYLPLGLEEDTRKYVLLHEGAHIRRGDPIVKAAAFLALAVHWFNPVLWLAWVLACRDMEAACDEAVLRRSGEDIRKDYSAALLSLAAARPVRVPLAFGENDVMGRIKGVLRWRRPVAAAVAAFILLAAALGFVLIADPVDLPAPAEPNTSPEVGDGLRIRFPGETDWIDLDTLIPVPRSWADDELAGRNEAENMAGMLDGALGRVGFTSPTDGWLAFCLATNLGPVDDTYFYRTFDGGHTWEEYSHFTPRDFPGGLNWFGVTCVGFADEDHGYLATGRFNGAPVFRTGDGGRTWELLDLPLPDGNWECSDIWAADPRLTFTDPGGAICTVYSADGGASWRYVLPIDDPEGLPLDQLPWPPSTDTPSR